MLDFDKTVEELDLEMEKANPEAFKKVQKSIMERCIGNTKKSLGVFDMLKTNDLAVKRIKEDLDNGKNRSVESIEYASAFEIAGNR